MCCDPDSCLDSNTGSNLAHHASFKYKQTSSLNILSKPRKYFILCLHVLCLLRLAEADKEVQEAYKKIALARSKKKSPSKKEKDVAWKALKDREAILKQLESV